jgi:long-subunit fatty acid transport protein
MRSRLSVPLVLAVLFALLAPQTSEAQLLAAFTAERLGLLSINGTGARPMGMGYAYTAVSNDVFAPLFNPAGIAQLTNGELSASLDYEDRTVTHTFETSTNNTKNSYTALGHVAVFAPFGRYRRNLAAGFGVYNVGTSNIEYRKTGRLDQIPANVANNLTQTGNIYQYHFAFGGEISRRAALGISFAIWDERVSAMEVIDYSDAGSLAVFTDDVKTNLDGFSFNIGLLLSPTDNLKLGFLFTSPAWLRYRGDAISYYEGEYWAGGGWTTDPYYAIIDEKFTLPMVIRGGLSYQISSFLLSADVSYIDYSQTKYNDYTIIDETDPMQGKALDSVWNFYVGGEFAASDWFTARVGYYYLPFALGTMEEFTYIENDELVMLVDDFETISAHQGFTIGIGSVIDDVLVIHFSTEHSGFKRETTLLKQKISSWSFLLHGAYLF